MSRSRRLLRTYLLAIYLVVVLTPPALVLTVEEPRFRNLAIEISDLTGLLTLSMLVVALALPTRLHSILSSFGIERVLRTHRLIALIAVTLVTLHILSAFIGDPRGIGILNLTKAPRPVWAATTTTLAFLLLIAWALRRRKRQPRYEGWRMAHLGLAIVTLIAAGLHIWWLGHLNHRPAMRFVYAMLAEVATIIAIRRWIWLPLRAHGRSYVVDSVRPVSGNAVTVTVRAHSHAGLPFHAGQFAGLKIGSSPFVFEEHPFTIASTAEHAHLKEFTIKALGDFSELLIGLRPGRRVYLDGPYGPFTVDGVRSGGIRLHRRRRGHHTDDEHSADPRRSWRQSHHELVVAARTVEELMMRDEITELSQRLELQVTEVVQSPPPGWTGESGRVGSDLLDRPPTAQPQHPREADPHRTI